MEAVAENEVGGGQGHGHGPKFCVNIEGTEHDWPKNTITTEEIATLGAWDPSLGVVLVDQDNVERTLAPGEVVELHPGHGFCKKVRFKRGLSGGDRHETEVGLVRQYFPTIEYRDGWFRVPGYPLPVGWSLSKVDAAFKRNAGHPGAGPYGIYVPAGLRVNGAMPSNYSEPAQEQPPFGGSWGIFSWQPTEWRGGVEQVIGWSLLDWVRGFATRFAELN